MFALRHVVALLTVAGFAAACTEEAAITPSTNAAGGTASTTAPPSDDAAGSTADSVTTETVEAPTTPPPDTTVAENSVVETTSTVPATTIAPSTTVAATGDPTSVSTEYFVGGGAEAWLYLGRWTGTTWEPDRDDAQLLREPAAASGDLVIVHELDVAPIEGTVEGSGQACAGDGRTGPVISPAVAATEEPGSGYRAIAFPADWSTSPRPVAVVDASIESYVAAGQAALADLPVDASSGAIEQLVVADLDGDGDTEALVAFDGDTFSALLLVDANSSDSITIDRSAVAAVTSTTTALTPDATAPTFDTLRTLAVADLNGDGRFEVVTHAFQGGSGEVTVNAYDGTEVAPVLTAGC